MYRYRGLTLIELLMTLAVLGIIIAIAVPSFNDLIIKRKLRGAAELVYSQLLFAKSQAIKESQEIRVTFTDGSAGTWDFGMTNAATDCTPGSVTVDCLLAYADGSENEIAADFDGADFPDVTIGGGAGTIVFTPLPGLMTAAAITIATTDPAYNLQVDVNIIGAITMCSPSDGKVSGYATCAAATP